MFWQQQRYVVLLFYTMFYKIFDIVPPWKQVLLGHKAEEVKAVVVKLPVQILYLYLESDNPKRLLLHFSFRPPGSNDEVCIVFSLSISVTVDRYQTKK